MKTKFTVHDLNRHNKEMRRKGFFFMQFDTLEEYIDYVNGKRVKIPQSKSSKKYIQKNNTKPYIRSNSLSQSIQSLDTRVSCAPKSDSCQYSGTYVVGLATMHKSNTTVVTQNTDPVIFATMRR